jgi:hypothetical protein
MRRLLVVLAAASVVGVLLAPSAASAKNAHVYQPNSHPFGASHGQWQARWFQWFMNIPAPLNPIFDETGKRCAVNQSGPVWFTAPLAVTGTITRTCRIPTGTGIFIIGVANECSNIEPPPFFGATEAELRGCAAAGFEEFWGDAAVTIAVDGVSIGDTDRYRVQTPLFDYTLPADNLFGLPAGTTATKAISDGQGVIVKPLPPGAHRIVFHLDAPILGEPTTLIYELTVVPRGRF